LTNPSNPHDFLPPGSQPSGRVRVAQWVASKNISGVALIGFSFAVTVFLMLFIGTNFSLRPLHVFSLFCFGGAFGTALFSALFSAIRSCHLLSDQQPSPLDPSTSLGGLDYMELNLWIRDYPEDIPEIARWFLENDGKLTTGHLLFLRNKHGKGPREVMGGFDLDEILVPKNEWMFKETIEEVAGGGLMAHIKALELDKSTNSSFGHGKPQRL